MGVGSELLANGMNPAWAEILDTISPSLLPSNNTWTGTNTFNASVTAYAVNGWGYIAPGINGVVGNGSTDDTAAIQTILNTYVNIFWAAGSYLISKTLSVDLTKNPRIYGQGGSDGGLGTLVIGNSTFNTSNGLAVIELSAPSNWAPDFVFSGIQIRNKVAGSGPLYGLFCKSSDSTFWNGFKGLIVDTHVSGFAFNMLFRGCRQFSIYRCTITTADNSGGNTTGEWGMYFYSLATGDFVGDLDVVDCVIISSPNSGFGVGLTDQGAAGGIVSGIRFTSTVVYSSSIMCSINMSGIGSRCSDIWWNPGCQFEGTGSDTGLEIRAAATAVAYDIHIEGLYMSGSGFSSCVNAATGPGSVIRLLSISNNFLANASIFIEIDASGGGTIDSIQVQGNTFFGAESNGGAMNFLDGVTNVIFSNNLGTNYVNTPGQFLLITSSGDYFVMTGNNTGGGTTHVLDGTLPAHSVYVNNI